MGKGSRGASAVEETAMKEANSRRPRLAAAGATAALALVLCVSHQAGGQKGGTVYYQVTYSNGTIRDLSEVPRTDQGIRMVLRISFAQPGPRGHSIVGTGPVAFTSVNDAQTRRDELKWNGQAWVGDAAKRRELVRAPRRATSRPVAPRAEARQAGAAQAALKKARERLAVCDEAVVVAAENLVKAQKTGRAPAARLLLEKAQEARQEALREAAAAERGVGRVKRAARPLPRAHGKVGTCATCPLVEAQGIVKPIKRRRCLPHRVQVWRLPGGKGRRTYRLTMAHPEAGTYGAFHYVAYADTDGDGRPDRLIARSPLAAAAAPGGWSTWSFTTSHPAVFVGNAWPYADTALYSARGGEAAGENWQGLSSEVYVSGLYGAVPGMRLRHWPYLTNLRVRVVNPADPAYPAGGSRIID